MLETKVSVLAKHLCTATTQFYCGKWRCDCLLGENASFFLCSFTMRMFLPFKKTMRRGSSLKFIALRNYQNNCAFTIPAKSNICHLQLPLNTVSKWSTTAPWKQKEILQVHCGISPLPSIPGRLVKQKDLGRNALHMWKWPTLELPCWELGTQYHFDVLHNTLRVKRFREENSLAICLLTQYVKCQSIHTEEKMWWASTKLPPFTFLATPVW